MQFWGRVLVSMILVGLAVVTLSFVTVLVTLPTPPAIIGVTAPLGTVVAVIGALITGLLMIWSKE